MAAREKAVVTGVCITTDDALNKLKDVFFDELMRLIKNMNTTSKEIILMERI